MEERKILKLNLTPVKTQEELKAEKRQVHMAKERKEKKAALKLRKHKNQQLFDKLFHDYPNCFSKDSPKPLKQGIYLDLAKDLDLEFSKQRLRVVLHPYTNSRQYNQAMLTESHRIDLMGNPVEEISEAHRQHAQQKLSFLEAKKKMKQTGA